ncbi:MAG: DEAD/DEAH box helicase family protein [Firmicutes bacterium]|nr:DEAD/DEAH box helicase family protein [Bacillota bacterium]
MALPARVRVVSLTFVSLSHDIAIDVEFHCKDGIIYARGLQGFFQKILGDGLQGDGLRRRKPRLYIGKAFNVRNTYIIATRAELAEALEIDAAHVDDFIRFSWFLNVSRRGRRAADDVIETLIEEELAEKRPGEKKPAKKGLAEKEKKPAEEEKEPIDKKPAVREVEPREGARFRETLGQEPERKPEQGIGQKAEHKPGRRPEGHNGKPERPDRSPDRFMGLNESVVNGIDLEGMAREIIKDQLLLPAPDDNSAPSIDISIDRASVDLILERLQVGRFDSLESADVHEQALLLSTSPGFDRLISLDVVRNIVPFTYQVGAVKEVLRRMRGRAILADEVGLGKTIEAGLVMMEYILRGLAKRVLILCPPPLMSQWMDEMRSKFNMDFVASDDPSFTGRENPWLEIDRIVASIDTAKREPHSKLVQSAPFDLVIVDEAHRCRNRNTLNWKLVNGLKKKYILLLTATPVQNDLHELFNLITLLRPGQLETASDFSRRFITRGDRLKPKNVTELRTLMGEVMIRNRRETCGIQLPRRRAETVQVALSPEEAEFYSRVSEFVRARYGGHDEYSRHGEHGEHGEQSEHDEHDERNERGRNEHDMHDAHDVRDGHKAHKVHKASRATARLTLKTLQKEAGSSAFAAVPTLRRMRESGHFADSKEELEYFIGMGQAIESSAKAEALLKLLRNINEKVMVFTGYTATLEFLAQFLKKSGVSFATFSGEMPRLDKERAVEAFKGDRQVLLSTESGGEGRNLQFCHVMVNFDLPWNPMKIEQRIGRIHRIGQENDVFVFNLSAARTLEAHILDILDAKINMFELVVGELDMILGNIEEEEDFEDTIMDLWAGAKTEEELQERFGELGERLARARAQYEETKMYEDNIFGSELGSGGGDK